MSINEISSDNTADIVEFSSIENLTLAIEKIKSVIDGLDTVMEYRNKALAIEDQSWLGESKNAYLDLQHFQDQFFTDLPEAIKGLNDLLDNINLMFEDIENSTVLTEIRAL